MAYMQTAQPTWKARADAIGLGASTLALATGVSVHTVLAYRRGSRVPPATWVRKVEWFLADVERSIERGVA